MSSAASPTVRDAFTSDDAPVLCLVCTGTATGSRLVATLTVRGEFTLAEVRHLLERLARTGDGGELMVRDAPTNVTEEQAEAILRAPLHPFDLTAPFSFVHSGGCRSFSKAQEERLTCATVFPRFPRLGVPDKAVARGWAMSPAAPLVVVPYFSPPTEGTSPEQGHTAHADTGAQLTHAQKRLAAAVLFVAQGEPHHTQLERAMTERLLLSQLLGGGTSGSVTAPRRSSQPTALSSTFGQRFSLTSWSSAVTRWNANITDFTGRTVLQEAASLGNDVAVKFLLTQSYVSVDAQTRTGNTALHMAVHGNHASVVRLLLDDGAANALVANAQGNTPLHVALLEQRAGLVAMLCQRLRSRRGDEVSLDELASLKNRDGHSPVALFERYSPSALELAQEGRLVPFKALVSHPLFNPRHLRARECLLHGTVVHAAASSGNAELLRVVCDQLTVFPPGSRGAESSPVNLSAMATSSPATGSSGASTLLRWMLDGRFQTPMHTATMRGHLDCVRYLVTRYAQWLTVPDMNGDTPLLLAIKYRQFHIAEYFLLQCAPGTIGANVCDHRGLTALHYVCGLGMAPAAETLLVQHGAKANASADRLLIGSVCRPLNNNSRIWEPHQRNRLLVSAGAAVELSSAKRAEAARAARRGVTVTTSTGGSASPSSTAHLATSCRSAAPRVRPSCCCGGGLRGSTPLLCALAAGLVLDVHEVLRLLCQHGAIDNKEDACDLLFYLISHGHERLANEIIQSSQDDGLVRAVAADNVLLLRFCEARVERGIRWCVETRCGACDRPASLALSGGITHPLVMSAAAGDVGAVQYFLSKGVDVNLTAAASSSVAVPSHPLLAAIHYQQDPVVRLLVQGGARLSSGDGSWCALQAAALAGLESVVSGLLGCSALSGYDVAQALVALLQRTYATSLAGHTARAASAASPRWRSRATAAREERDERIAMALAAHYDPTAAELHPAELLHLSAARGLFTVTRALLRRLAMLPATLRAEVVRTAPAAPAHTWRLIEPEMAAPSGHVKRLTRLLPNAASGKGGLYRPPRPFERLVLPSWRRVARADQLLIGSSSSLENKGRLAHRLHARDVFSYAAGANEVDLLRQIRDVLPEMMPWTCPDVRGWTAMDYALGVSGNSPAEEVIGTLLLTAVSPRARHGRRLLATRATTLARAVQTLVPWSRAPTHDASSSSASQGRPAGQHSSANIAARLAATNREGERLLSQVLCALLRRGPCDVDLAGTMTTATTASAKGGFVCHADQWTLQTARTLLESYRHAQGNAAALLFSAQAPPDGLIEPSTPSSSPSSRWLLPVVHTAVQFKHLDVLELLEEVLACPFRTMSGFTTSASTTTTPGASVQVVPSPLLSAVACGDEEIIAFLLRARCSAYETSPMTMAMAALIPLKHAESCVTTPLCYAAWMGRVDLVLQLVGGSVIPSGGASSDRGGESGAARQLKPEQCADEGAQLGDALKALFQATSLARCRARQPEGLTDTLLAKAVRALAGVGHPYLSPLVLRAALVHGLTKSARALVQSYGANTVLVDLIPEEISSLHHLAASPALVPLLRSLLAVPRDALHDANAAAPKATAGRAAGLDVLIWTPLALALRSMDFTRAPMDPVDYALAHGCADGALLLLAAGWTGGSGRVEVVHAHPPRRTDKAREKLVAHLQSVLRHFQSRRDLYQRARSDASVSGDDARHGYSVLHSAIILGHDDVISGLVEHMCRLPRSVYAQDEGQPERYSAMHVMCEHRQREHPRWRRQGRFDTSDDDAPTHTDDDTRDDDESRGAAPGTARAVAPSVYALAALHARGAHCLSLLEEVARSEQRLQPRDLVCFVFNPSLRVTRVVDALCRQAINSTIYGQVFSILPESLRTATSSASMSPQPELPYAVFFAKLWHDRAPSLLFHAASRGVASHRTHVEVEEAAAKTEETSGARHGDGGGGTWALTACTALAAAVASGRLEWVQYMAFCEPSMRQHRATLTRCDTAGRRGCGDHAPLPSAPRYRSAGNRRRGAAEAPSHTRASRRTRPRPHRCGEHTHWPQALCLTADTVGIDALVLCVLYMAQAFHARNEARRLQYTDIFTFLLSLPSALTVTNVNVVAMALAAMAEWSLVELLLARADQFRRLLTTRLPPSHAAKSNEEDEAGKDSDGTTSTRYFAALLDEEIPVVLQGLIGPARHVMHIVARHAPKEMMIEVARRSQRTDVETCVDADGRTALYHALHHYNATECGLACFAVLRVPLHTVCCQRTGRTALMVAASEGRLHLMTTLLESSKIRTQIDQCDRRGCTPLMLAAAHGHADVVELLLATGATASAQSRRGRTAVMLAAENGHDSLAASLAQHFSHTRDLVTAQTTVLHAAARGRADRTMEIVLKQLADPVAAALQLDGDGHTALYVAHAFGNGAAVRALLALFFHPSTERHPLVQEWASQSLAVLHAEEDARDCAQLNELNASDPWFSHVRALYEIDDEATQARHRPGPAWQRLGTGAVLSADACDARLYLCDPRLTTYGWWRHMLEVNEVLAREAEAATEAWSLTPLTASRPSSSSSSLALASLRLRPGEKVIAPQIVPWREHARGPRGDSLTCLLWCVQANNAVGVRVLADYNVADVDGRALRWAAKCGHLDVIKLLLQLQMSDPSQRGEDDGLYAFEVAAHHQHKACALYLLSQTRLSWLAEWVPPLPPAGGDEKDPAESAHLFVHTVFHQLAPVCEGEVLVAFVDQLMAATAAPSSHGSGGGALALACARLWAELQRPDEVGLTPFEYTVARGNAASVLRTAQLMQRLSDGAQGLPMGQPPSHTRTDGATAVTISSALLAFLPALSPAVRTVLFDFFALQDVCHTVGFCPPSPSSTSSTGRLRFGDVRLLGIAALRRHEAFRGALSSVYTVDHERQVLRGLLYDFPFRIRYEPESFRQCTLAEQISLLQWLSSSLLLDAYEGISASEVETIEVSVVKHRSHEFLDGIGTVNLAHSLYLSNNQYLSVPDVKNALWSAIQRRRAVLCRRVRAAAKRATKTLQSLPHPALRHSVVSVEWPLQRHESDIAPWSASGVAGGVQGGAMATPETTLDDNRTWEPVTQSLCESLSDLEVYLRGEVLTVLSAVKQESDIAAVVARGGGHQAPATSPSADSVPPCHVIFRFTDGDAASLASTKAQLRSEEKTGTCVILFNEFGMAPLRSTLSTTLLRAVKADVSLVGIHYARSRFLKSLRSAMQTALEDDTKEAHHPKPSPTAAAPPAAPSVQFKLELESSRVERIPQPSLEAMLDAAVEAVTLLLFHEVPRGHCGGAQAGSLALLRCHASQIVRDSVLRRLRQVLVLFTTRRDALVRFTGDKLMLCFSHDSAPNTSEILTELKRAALEDEVVACQRALPEVLAAMQEKLLALLPSARLVLDEASLTRAVCTAEEDNPSDMRITNAELQASAYRLLVAQHSRHVLQPLIEGLCAGWDTPIGAVARQELREVHVRMETAEGGSCYLTPDGERLIYYCPLHCVQNGSAGGAFGSWQLLTATQVAALYVMQLLVRHRALAKAVDREKTVACWTRVTPLCVARVGAGETTTLRIQARNLLNQPVRQGGESFTFVGRGITATSVRVFEHKRRASPSAAGQRTQPIRGDGRYVVRLTAPVRVGDERLHILLHGQPVAASPLRLKVESGAVALGRTRLVVPYNTVLKRRPFKVFLELRDTYGNHLTAMPHPALAVRLPHDHADRSVTLLRWTHEGPSRVAVELVVSDEKPALTLALELTCADTTPSATPPRSGGSGGAALQGSADALPAEVQTHVCVSEKNALSVVTRHRLEEICALLGGQTLDSVPERQRRRRARQRLRRQRQRLLAEAAQASVDGVGAVIASPVSPARVVAPDRFSPSGSPTGQRTMTMSDREKLFFRRTIRQSEKRRLRREAAQIEGGVEGRTFPPELLRETR